MIPIQQANRLLDSGFSLLTAGFSKVPNFAWKHLREKPYTKEEFEKCYNYKGGKKKKNGDEIEKTEIVGIITGYGDVECIDVDLKVFSTAEERRNFWDEYIAFLKDNIYDFNDKFVIYKTASEGFHILFKSKRVDGNQKIAKLKGHKEAVIETRGVGGYIVVYEKKYTERSYHDIEYISDWDRDILFECSKTFNYIDEEKSIEKPPVKVKEYEKGALTPWDDYNNKVSIFDIISDDFNTVRKMSDKYLIKRHNAKSVHSGYVYANSGCMYLFSTGTIYPAEQLISPFKAYAIKEHNEDFSAAAKQLYKDGYGDRVKPKKEDQPPKVKVDKKELIFPIDIFPEGVRNYMLSCNSTLSSSFDYLGSALLWTTSIVIGNSIQIEVKRGWVEVCNLWLALVGKAGIGKTPSISNITFPLTTLNSKEIKKYVQSKQKYTDYQCLSKKEKELVEEIKEPNKTQFIVNDITLEALVELHDENKNGIGVLKDELAGWLKGMNQYRAGADLEHWLSSWNGKEINLNRKTSKSSFVDKAFIPVLGGIQPGILENYYTEDNKDSGFLDRLLFAYPDLNVEKYNEDEMEESYINWYSDYITSFFQVIRNNVRKNESGEIKPLISRFSEEAKREWVRIFNDITEKQNSDEENEYLKSMLPKQKSYIPRFALIINTLDCYERNDNNLYEISKESILKAEKLSTYFISMAKKIKVDSAEINKIKGQIKKNVEKTELELFKEIYSKDNEVNLTHLAEQLNVSRRTLIRWKSKI